MKISLFGNRYQEKYKTPLRDFVGYLQEAHSLSVEADFAAAGETESIRVSNIYSDDFMLLSLISQEEADELIRDREVETAQDPETGRVTTEVYCELENTTFHFLTLVSENGKVLRAEGVYSMEAAEGNAKYFRRILDSAVLAVPADQVAE